MTADPGEHGFGSGIFAPRSWAEVVELIQAAPLAWVVSSGGAGFAATPLPLRPRTDDEGRLVRLDGHLARANPQVAALRQDPRVLILFMGVGGYISPSWMHDRTQAPTWTYASVQVQAELELFEDPDRLRASLDDLVGANEAGRPNAWAIDEMGARYERLGRGIIGFEARVLKVAAKFKLGQDERDDTFGEILTGLGDTGQDALAHWITRFNPHRA
jgi:transcriptional regulator